MPRIRSIKPEFWTSEQVADVSPTGRLLFVGMWTFADDRGVHPWSPKQLKMTVFPGDEVTLADIEGWMIELWHADLILRFEADGRQYFVVSGWHHQKIEKPRYKHPDPKKYQLLRAGDDQSPTSRRPVADESTQGEERRGVDSSGEDGSCVEPECSPQQPEEPESPPIIEYPTSRNGETWGLRQEHLDTFTDCYPGIDVMAQCRAALAWCVANPKQRKTASGMLRFLNGWLAKEQNRSRGSPSPKQSQSDVIEQARRLREERAREESRSAKS